MLDIKNLKPGHIVKYFAPIPNGPPLESLWILLEEETHPAGDVPLHEQEIKAGHRRMFKLYHLYDSRNSIDINNSVSYCFSPHNARCFTLEVK